MGQVFQEELLEEGSDGACAYADKDVVDSDLGVVFLAVGIVEAGDTAGGEIAEDVGVVWLPVSVVAFADDYRRDGVEGAVDDLSFSLVEVAGVLVEEGWQERGTEEG